MYINLNNTPLQDNPYTALVNLKLHSTVHVTTTHEINSAYLGLPHQYQLIVIQL